MPRRPNSKTCKRSYHLRSPVTNRCIFYNGPAAMELLSDAQRNAVFYAHAESRGTPMRAATPSPPPSPPKPKKRTKKVYPPAVRRSKRTIRVPKKYEL